jgi:hypothetical protein
MNQCCLENLNQQARLFPSRAHLFPQDLQHQLHQGHQHPHQVRQSHLYQQLNQEKDSSKNIRKVIFQNTAKIKKGPAQRALFIGERF